MPCTVLAPAHGTMCMVHLVRSPCLAMLCTSTLALVCTGQTQTRATPLHASTRLLHPPPAPDGSPHALRTQAPSADYINIIYALWWGRRVAFGPPGWSCHGPKPANGAPRMGSPHRLLGPPFSALTHALDGS